MKEEDVKDLDIVTTSKITARELDKPEYSKVAVGVEPTIWHEHNAQAPATMLRPSTTTIDVVAVGVAPTIQTLRTRASSTALRASTTTIDNSIAQAEEIASTISNSIRFNTS